MIMLQVARQIETKIGKETLHCYLSISKFNIMVKNVTAKNPTLVSMKRAFSVFGIKLIQAMLR